jgi:rhodanese-related sulfurtransferase
MSSTFNKPAVDLTREDIKQGLADGSIVVVDVREANEYEEGHIPGAILNPLSNFDPAALPKGKRVVLSCRAGVRSLKAMAMAQEAGVDIDEHYKGGFKDWAEAGEPVER